MKKKRKCVSCLRVAYCSAQNICRDCVAKKPERTIFEYVEKYRDDGDFEPTQPECQPTDTLVGSQDRLEVMQRRLDRGEPLFHYADSRGFENPSR